MQSAATTATVENLEFGIVVVASLIILDVIYELCKLYMKHKDRH